MASLVGRGLIRKPDRLFRRYIFIWKRVSIGYDSAGSDVSLFVIAFYFAYFYALDAGVYESYFSGGFVVVHYNTYMTDVLAAAATGEEYQVSFAKVVTVYRYAFGVLYTGSRGNIVSELAVDVAGIS